MALTTEQQAQLDIQLAVENARYVNQMAVEAKRAKFEAVRLAKEVLIENSRSQPVESRGVTAEAITSFAAVLVGYVNG